MKRCSAMEKLGKFKLKQDIFVLQIIYIFKDSQYLVVMITQGSKHFTYC